jgi:hypothetical protein
VNKVYNAKINFWIDIPYRKIGHQKRAEKSFNLKIKNFRKKLKSTKFLFLKKLNWGSVFTFKLPLNMGYMGHGRKNTQSLRAKFRFSPKASGCLDSELIGKDGKKIPTWCFLPPKSIIDLSSPIKLVPIIRLGWKFASILRLNRAFKCAIKLENRRRSLFDLPDF